MSDSTNTIETFANQEYKWGFVTDIEADAIPRGLSEDVVRLISAKKQEPEWLPEWRLKAYRHWLTLKEPEWANVSFPKIDYQDIIYYSSPKAKGDGPKTLDDVDPELLKTYEKLGIPLQERAILAGVAVDAPRGPAHLNRLDEHRVTQPEVEPVVAGREVAAATGRPANPPLSLLPRRDPRALTQK